MKRRLMNAIKDNIEDEMEKNGYTVKHIEGNRESRWILMDYGDIVVHLFIPEERELYHLEKLWGDQHRIDISSYLTNP